MSHKHVAHYWKEVGKFEQLAKDWRLGQLYFNILNEEFPELADQIRATAMDPYHKKNGELIPFVAWVGGELMKLKEKT